MRNKIILLHTGGIKKGLSGKWQSLEVGDAEAGGFCNDRWRIAAAVMLYRHEPRLVMTTGGVNNKDYKLGDPTVARVYANELFDAGVPGEDVLPLHTPYTSYAEFGHLLTFLIGCRVAGLEMENIVSVSNEWHLPRLRALVEHAPGLEALRGGSFPEIEFVSAEAVLIEQDGQRWKAEVERVRSLPAYAARLVGEQRGIEQIKAGTYRFG